MRNGFLASLPGLLVGASLGLGQPSPAPVPESAPPVKESEPAPAGAAPAGSALGGLVPPLNVFDGLTSHFEGTCDRVRGNVFVADVDYLFWVMRNPNVPASLASNAAVVPLVANGAVLGSALSVTGPQPGQVLTGQPFAQNLIGQQELAYNHRPSSGMRISLAYWQEDPLPEMDWDRPRTFAVEGNFLFLGERGIAIRNDTAPNLVRPFFALNSQSESALVVAAPGIANGGVTATANYGMWGGELNFWKNIYYEYPGKTIRVDLLAGFRYLDLGEDFSVTSLSNFTAAPNGVFVGQSQTVQVPATPPATGTTTVMGVVPGSNSLGFNYSQGFAGNQLLINDLFSTRNQFYGGQLGVVAKFFLEVFDVNLAAKMAFGGNAEQLLIDGFQFRTANGTTTMSRGGLLALASNIGRFHQGEFSVVPEFDATATLVICRHVSLTAGYQFLYWTKVVRPENQIDRVIDVTQVPNLPAVGVTPTGVARPAVTFHETDFWAQGLVVGLQFVW